MSTAANTSSYKAVSSFVSPSTQDLISSMAEGPSTNRWDIVCSYSLEQLNAMLQANYGKENSGIVKEVKLSTIRNNPLGDEKFTISYDILFDAPSLEFIAGINGMCNLKMKIASGTYTVTPEGSINGKTTPIPQGKYTIIGAFPLVAVYGNNEKKAESGTVIVFSSNQSDRANITLHFSNTTATKWSVDPAPGPQDQDILETYFLPVLEQYFRDQVQEIDYVLASLKSQQCFNSSSGPIVIEPYSFVFVTAGDQTNGILSLYIQTVNSGNEQGNLAPSFQPGDKAMLPIPQGYHASLILSKDFLQKVYLLPQLTHSNFINVVKSTAPIGIGNDGCTVKGAYNSTKKLDRSCINFSYDQVVFNPFTIDYKNWPFTFAFSQNNLKVSMSLSESVPWRSSSVTPYGPVPGPAGTATAIISLNKCFDLASICKLTDEDIAMGFTVSPEDYHTTVQPGTDDSCWNNKMASKVTKGIMNAIGSIIPTTRFSLGGINFFKETNLLFPGQKILTFDASVGIHIPCDLILIGNFIQK